MSLWQTGNNNRLRLSTMYSCICGHCKIQCVSNKAWVSGGEAVLGWPSETNPAILVASEEGVCRFSVRYGIQEGRDV